MLVEVSSQTFVSTNAGHTFICININSLLVDYSRFHLVKNGCSLIQREVFLKHFR